MEGVPRGWATQELLDELAGSQLLARTSTAGPAMLPESLRSLASDSDPGWERQLSEISAADRAELARAWWRCLEKPGQPQVVFVRENTEEGWRNQRIFLLDLRHQSEIGVVLVAVLDLGPCEPPEPEEPTRPATLVSERAWFHRPTWILQELDAVGLVVTTEGDVEQVFGRTAAELVGNTVLNFLHPDDHPACLEMWSTLLEEPGGTRTILQRVLRPDGSHLWIESTVINRLHTDGGGVVLAVSHDITERRNVERGLRNMALSDTLTGLPNRLALAGYLDDLLSRGSATVAFLDLDGFKEVNDRLGHHTGDDVLAAIALRLDSHLPPNAMVGRWGGDEFVLLAPGSSEELLAEAINAAFSDPVWVAGGGWHPRASWGAVIGEPGDKLEQLVGQADTAMYQAKESQPFRWPPLC